MLKSLWIKFLILLFAVAAVALSSAFFLRELMLHDFREYLEGEREDRVFWVTADLEHTYEKHGGWNRHVLAEDAVWALMLGFEIRVTDMSGSVVMDTDRAMDALSAGVRRKILSILAFRSADRSERPIPYPLFLGGKEIGRLDVRFLRPRKEAVFIRRANTFLLLSLLALGGIATVLSVLFSRKLTQPIQRLTAASSAIREGNLKQRVAIEGSDEISRLSATFNEMAHALEKQEGLRKKLIANVAHELRTPLGAMQGELEGMIDGLLPTDKGSLQSLHDETDRLRNIVEGIEDVTEAEASALLLKKQQVALEPFLTTIVERYRALFQDKGITIDLDTSDAAIIHADPDRVSQVVINLLTNALKATDAGGTIRIRTGLTGTEAFIEIADSGCGVEAEQLPHIFERFFKVSGDGLGLGLAIVKELIEAHGGRIDVQSERGRGTVFSVYFPVPASS